MKTLAQAHRELKGDLGNTHLFELSNYDDNYLFLNVKRGHYLTDSDKNEGSNMIPTIPV